MGALSYFEDGGEVEEPTTPVETKPTAGKGKYAVATPVGNVPMSQGVLDAMEQLYKQKLEQQGSFMEHLKDAAAWWDPNYGAMDLREKQKQSTAADMFQIQTQLAQFKAAQEAAKNWQKSMGFGAPAAGAPAAGAPAAGAPAAVPQWQQIVNSLPANLRPQALEALRTGNQAAFNKLVTDIELKKNEDVKRWEYINKMPDGPEKEMMIRQYFPEVFKPSTRIGPGGEEIKYDPLQQLGRPTFGQAPTGMPSATPKAAPAAPTGGGGAPGMLGSIPSGSVAGVEQRGKDYERSQNVFFETVTKPLSTQVVAAQPVNVEIDRALGMLDNTEVGPGTSIKMALTEAKGVFSNLPQKQVDNLINLKTIDQTQKTLVASGIKAAYGAQLSDKEGDRFTKTLFTINDPKQFIRATLELRKANNIYNQRMLEFINNNPHNTAQALDKFKKTGVYDQIIKEYAPTVYAEFQKGAPKAGKPATTASAGKTEEIDFSALPTRKPK